MSFEDLVEGISSLRRLRQENSATRCIAKAIYSKGVRHFWTAKTAWSCLGGSALATSWRGTKKYDLSWSEGKSSEPDHISQVKIGTKAQEDQEVLLFLGDVVFAGLDTHLFNKHAFAFAIVPAKRETQYWRRLVSKNGLVDLILEPNSAGSQMACGSKWIDPVKGEIRPFTESQYSKIFGAGTNAKFVGLFKRKGKGDAMF